MGWYWVLVFLVFELFIYFVQSFGSPFAGIDTTYPVTGIAVCSQFKPSLHVNLRFDHIISEQHNLISSVPTVSTSPGWLKKAEPAGSRPADSTTRPALDDN